MGKRIQTPVTAQQMAELEKLAKRANQRLASMKEGQREAVGRYVSGKFSRKIAKSMAEYEQRMREIERFLSSKQTTRSGWEEIKRTAVESAGQTLRDKRHYELTDQELANIFKEIDKKSQKQFYKVLDIVQAKKYDAEAKGKSFDNEALQQAVNQAVKSHMSAGEAIRYKTRAEGRKERSSGSLRK